jgi:hypothetical protein
LSSKVPCPQAVIRSVCDEVRRQVSTKLLLLVD